MPAILPGVDLSVGGERPIHFLVIFAPDTDPDDIDRAIANVFRAKDRFDPRTGTPRATGRSVIDFLDDPYEFCRPPSRNRNLTFVVVPAHVDGRQGLSREVMGGAAVRGETVATSIWDEMKGHLRQRRAQLERELVSLRSMDQEPDEIESRVRETRLRLVEMHEARLDARREQARSLEVMGADVRLEVLPFRDRGDFERRRRMEGSVEALRLRRERYGY